MVGRILIEVTEFLHTSKTQSSLSGVPRTVVEVGSRLVADRDLEVALIFYNKEAGEFYFADSDVLNVPTVSVNTPVRRGSTEVLRNSFSMLTRPLRRGSVYRRMRRIAASIRHRDPVNFQVDDTVLLLGASWAPPGVSSALLMRKGENDFGIVTLIYDVIPVTHPQVHVPAFVKLYSSYLREILPVSRTVMAISRSAAAGVEAFAAAEHMVVPAARVVLLGDSASDFKNPRRPANLPDGDFLLYVSTVEPRKNQMILYQAFKQARLDGRRLPRIILVGRAGWLTDDFRYILENDPDVGDGILWLKSVTDPELGWLYEHALFTVFPSIVEGWGLPIAESLAHGKFCIACDTSSMPEVGGDLVDYVSPWDAAAWASEIHRYASDPDALNARVARIRSEYRPRSWDATADVVRSALTD